jgi:hypothetical protein
MNRIIIPSLLAAAFGASALAQQPPQPRRVVPPPPNIVQPGQLQPGQEQPESDLPYNVKLHLEGNAFGAFPIDLSVATGGREVSADLPLNAEGEQPVIGSFQAFLTPGEKWQAAITLGAQVPIQVGGGKIEYRSLMLRTTVRIAPGKKVVLWEKGDQKLTLTMSEEKD